ncbi:hypothetical protein [Streptomyces sp. NBC_01187]|uniref:hypothetical protein n=3 Tax=Streptomyces TaxID=1883 RepID=UPI0038639A62|nr:hypothetical protein OG220_21495 [Streptomyces sp. NBC_01187]
MTSYRSAACGLGRHGDCRHANPRKAPTGVPVTYEACACACHKGMEGTRMWIYDRERTPASAAPELRLLPWVTDAGNPCYLSGEADSVLAVYADELEDAQLADGARALRRIVELLDNVAAADDETAQTVKEAAAALSNVLRVADSRGARLPDAEEDAGHSPG